MIKQISFETLNNMSVSKGELFKALQDTFDYALPQDWLNDFSTWAEKNVPIVTYHLIASTTVWVYPKHKYYGFPVSVCKEVHNAYLAYIKSWKTNDDFILDYLNDFESVM